MLRKCMVSATFRPSFRSTNIVHARHITTKQSLPSTRYSRTVITRYCFINVEPKQSFYCTFQNRIICGMPMNKVRHAQRASFYTVKGLATPYPSPTDNSRKEIHTYDQAQRITPDTNRSEFDTNVNSSNNNPILGQGTVFQEGELVVLTEKNAKVQRTRGKIHSIMVQLLPKKTFRSHAGHILLSHIINLRVGKT
ncbi:hypothetical protein SARC_14553 [Sphaeroforma arctica JP610]|uniref:Uncharacterized protein n=1 Tax=Sphaeroforma arctica JP610 TaxID=667725 RepID=A0A0L0F838_9EUKA|nr:hypothetical protein SARC_14553 [Sphaeroforma arctica JP610]KNC72887.1 hypothetical protein SARC_14553 [Sphaeroforma arctica JP610]|eukprot:XP_014146789.1 hypothetical protein SARC_14553 [Sphaeroforma arctica JP610]